MMTPYEKHQAQGHAMTRQSPDGFSIIEECTTCGARFMHSPAFKYPITLSPDHRLIEHPKAYLTQTPYVDGPLWECWAVATDQRICASVAREDCIVHARRRGYVVMISDPKVSGLAAPLIPLEV